MPRWVFVIPISVAMRAASRRLAWERLEAEIAPALLGGSVDDLWLPRTRELEANGQGWMTGTLTLGILAESLIEARSYVRDDVLCVANARPGFRAMPGWRQYDRHASRVRPAARAATRTHAGSASRR